jgi:predicted ATPase
MYHIENVIFTKCQNEAFPYHLPFFNDTKLEFNTPITILVGENGCGKSTFLDLLNEILHLYRIDMENEYQKDVKDIIKQAAKYIKVKNKLTIPKGFYFTAEDFTSYIYKLVKEKNYALNEIRRVDSEYQHKSDFTRELAASPFNRTINELDNMYPRELLKSSHGEAYLTFFNSRVRSNELYLLDEPETPLSIQNQLTLIYIINEAVKNNCQFIIATHSPILMAIPNATIYDISDNEIKRVEYNDIDAVNLLKQFLNQPDQFFKYLLS